MKVIIIIMMVLFSYIVSDTNDNNCVENVKIIDTDYLKNEMQNTVLDFIKDMELNPDSCYIPFKE